MRPPSVPFSVPRIAPRIARVIAPVMALVLVLLSAGCASEPLGDPTTALARVQALQQQGDTKAVAKLAGRVAESQLASAADRAEAAFLAGEAELALGEHAKAFERYRYILENAPWSSHAAVIEDRLYEIGKTLLFSDEYSGWFSDRTRGVDALETLTAHYRSSDRADDALKLCGDYYAGDDVRDWGEASLHYLRVADEYPDSEWAERCLWLAGHCQLQLAAGPRYDRNDLLQARETLERSLSTHPHGVAVKEARADLVDTLEKLAAAELVVADFYDSRGVTEGANLRLANAALALTRRRWPASRRRHASWRRASTSPRCGPTPGRTRSTRSRPPGRSGSRAASTAASTTPSGRPCEKRCETPGHRAASTSGAAGPLAARGRAPGHIPGARDIPVARLRRAAQGRAIPCGS